MIRRLMNGIFIAEGTGSESNIFIIDGELIIDSGTGKSFPVVKEFLEKNSMSPHTLVCTHCHYDHTGGVSKFRDMLGCAVAIHRKDAPRVEKAETEAGLFGESARVFSPDIVLEEPDMISAANFSFEVLHTPGHTEGSICLYEKEKKILISGDTLFDGSTGRTDLKGGSAEDMYKSLQKLSQLPSGYLLPGHGPAKVSGVQLMIRQLLAAQRAAERYA